MYHDLILHRHRPRGRRRILPSSVHVHDTPGAPEWSTSDGPRDDAAIELVMLVLVLVVLVMLVMPRNHRILRKGARPVGGGARGKGKAPKR